MDEEEDPLIEELAAAVADGRDVDWAAASAKSPGESGLIEALQVVAALGRVVLEQAAHDESVAHAPAPRDPRSDSLTSWGPLKIISEIGRGSFGRVFRAWEPRLERDVALKVLDGVPPGTETVVVAEARLLAQIRHENVVTVFGAEQVDASVGFWMEFIDGRTLKAMHEEYGRFSAQEALLIVLDVCRALAAVHRAGFVHGDVKAQNIIRQVGGRIILTDFGAGRLIRLSVNRRQRTTLTPFYAAPEVLDGAASSEQSDLYSLGVLLYYLVTGTFPVTGQTIDDFRRAHASGRRTLLRDARPDLPAAFIRVVDAATAALPEERPESAGALEALIETAAGRFGTNRRGDGTAGRKRSETESSIAVLPFVDMSADRGLGYFCEGLAEEIIDALGRIRGLHVVARASAFTFDGAGSKAQKVGAALDVKTVLQGSVRASGTQLRVSARLTDAATGIQLWSERFIRDLSDIFLIQDDIASGVVRELGLRLTPAPGGASVQRSPQGSEAYMLYLKGRYCWNQRTEAALQNSVAHFNAAIEKDSEYAPAYAALAEAYTTLGLYGVLAPHDIMPRAKAAARRAIDIAGDLSSPHATAGCIAAVYDWEWREAALSYHRALELNPDDPAAHHWYAINYLVPLRRFEEAAAELRRAADVDPLSMPIRASFGIRSYFAHDFEQAFRELRDCLDHDAGSGTARLFLGLTLVEMGRQDEAIRELETAAHVTGSPEMTAALGYACAKGGHVERARSLLGELLQMAERRYVAPTLVAQIHAGFGSADFAMEWLQRASEARAVDLAWLGVRPVFDSLRADARFNALLARMRQ